MYWHHASTEKYAFTMPIVGGGLGKILVHRYWERPVMLQNEGTTL